MGVGVGGWSGSLYMYKDRVQIQSVGVSPRQCALQGELAAVGYGLLRGGGATRCSKGKNA